MSSVETSTSNSHSCHSSCSAGKTDWLFRVCLTMTVVLYGFHLSGLHSSVGIEMLNVFSHSVFELLNTIWWGIAIGILMIAVLGKIPREFIMSALGTRNGVGGILRATVAGVLLDLCSHGILMVGAKLYEKGVSAGQVMAFLVSSPWNSLSLTLILIALIGLPWTIAFTLISMVIAVITGLIFDHLVKNKTLPGNPQQIDLPEDFRFWREARRGLSGTNFSAKFFSDMLIDGIKDSRMVVRWILFGILLAGVVRTLVSPEHFATYLGPTVLGLGVTMIAATILEVCSEGSTPVAADILTRANAPGNSFAFLMGGVSTDYTEIMVLKDATRSWKIALFLPLITLPQVIVMAVLVNNLAS